MTDKDAKKALKALPADAAYPTLPDDQRGAGDLVSTFDQTIADAALLAASVSPRKDVVLFGTGPKEKYTGKAVAKTLKKWKLSFEREGGAEAGLTSVGSVGWVAARLKGSNGLTYRAFFIYEMVDDQWWVVSAQFSWLPPVNPEWVQ